MFGHTFTGAPKKLYCSTFFNFAKNFPGSNVDSKECIEYIKIEDYTIQIINEIDPLTGIGDVYCPINISLMANVVACWQRAEFGKSSDDFLCKNIIVSKDCPEDSINMNEQQATQILIDEGACSIISNNDISIAGPMGIIIGSCGDSDQLEWKISTIGKNRNVLIEYANGKIIVS